MSTNTNIFAGLELSNRFFAPEESLKERGYYPTNHAVGIPLAVVVGTLKVFLFPLMVAVGVVAFPLIALARYFKGTGDASHYFQAWSFCLLGGAGVVGFMMISAFHFRLAFSARIFMGAIVISIDIHVYRASKKVTEQAAGNPAPGLATVT